MAYHGLPTPQKMFIKIFHTKIDSQVVAVELHVLDLHDGFQKWGYHQMDGLERNFHVNWWFRGTPIFGNPQVSALMLEIVRYLIPWHLTKWCFDLWWINSWGLNVGNWWHRSLHHPLQAMRGRPGIVPLPDGARLSTNFSTKLAPAQCCRGSGHVSKGGVIGFNSLQHFCFDFIHPGTYMWLLGALATHGNKAHKIALGTNTNLFELLDWCEAIVGSKEAINLVNLQHFTPG